MTVKLNPDRAKVIEIRRAIYEAYGYCPCKLIKSNDTLCPCKVFRETEECKCELYVKD